MKSRCFIVTVVVLAVAMVSGSSFVQAQNSNGNLTNNLFQQYYTPNGASQASAGLYPAPHWAPGYVGGTYYTYQPLQPHEMMYQHSRNYYNFQDGPEAFYRDDCKNCGNGGGSLNVTKVRWQSGVNHMGPLPFSTQPFSKLHYTLASNYYCARGNCGGVGGLIGGHSHCGHSHCGHSHCGHSHCGHGHCGHGHRGGGSCPTGNCNGQ